MSAMAGLGLKRDNRSLPNGGEVSKSSIEELAETISASALKVSDFLRFGGHLHPSFRRDAPTTTLPDSAPEDIKLARQNLMEAALQVFQLAVGPSEYLPNLAMGYHYISCLHWLIHFNIFRLVPLTESISYSELAIIASVSEQQLKSIARMAMTNNLFCETDSGSIAHSATSALLVSNSGFHDWAVVMTEASAPAAAKLVSAAEKWPSSVKRNETAYNLAFDTDLPFFDHLSTLPELTKRFAGYMKNVTISDGTAIGHLLNGFAWSALGKATIVDVGGSTGNASVSLAEACPDLNFIVQDLPENASAGREALSSLSGKISSRIFFQGNDFFVHQPFMGAHVYLLRMILHDWPDCEAITILKNIVQSMTSTSRIIIMDSVLPDPGTIPSTRERLLRGRDLTMMASFNSCERDMNDWEKLLRAADERLEIVNVVKPFESLMSIMEVTLRPFQ